MSTPEAHCGPFQHDYELRQERGLDGLYVCRECGRSIVLPLEPTPEQEAAAYEQERLQQ